MKSLLLRLDQASKNWDFNLKFGKKEVPRKVYINPPQKNVAPEPPIPIPVEEFRRKLKFAISKEKQEKMEQNNNQESVEEKVFSGLSDFVLFYIENKSKFSEAQAAALNTLVEAQGNISRGCECRRGARHTAAMQYYRTFITRNAQTDMMVKIKELCGGRRLVFLEKEMKFFEF